jgi:hypothetical protein
MHSPSRMTPRVRHTILVTTILTFTVSGCSSDQCEQQPNSLFCATPDETGDSGTGDTGSPTEECVPNLSPDEIGYAYTCQGLGNGWLVLDVLGDGVQPPECVNWGPDGKAKRRRDDRRLRPSRPDHVAQRRTLAWCLLHTGCLPGDSRDPV